MIYAGFHFVKSSTVKYFNRNDKTSEGPYLARFIFIPRHRFRDRAPDNLFAFVLSPLQLQPLYRVLVQEHFQRLGCGGVVVVQQRFVELLHVLIPDGQDAHSGLQQDLVCQRQAGALVAVPKELPARTPAEGVQRLFCG